MKIRITYELEIHEKEKFLEWQNKEKSAFGDTAFRMGMLMWPLSIAMGTSFLVTGYSLTEINDANCDG
jgi:hypothetical protein